MPGYEGLKGYTSGPNGAGGGALALIVESNDNTIVQNGSSSYMILEEDPL